MMKRKNSLGFSLVEMAVVLMILGILLNGLLVATGQSTANTRRIDARNQLRQFQEALYGFAQTFGRLPCPAIHTSDGKEEDPGGVGDCFVSHGFLPNSTLNLSGRTNADGLLLDPWGNPYRYSFASVDENNTTDRAFTSTTGLAQLFNDSGTDLVYSAGMLRICGEDVPATAIADCTDGNANVLSDLVPAVILTMGDNWATFTSSEEVANASGGTLGTYSVSNTNDFVNTEYSEENFDDMMIWLSPHILFSKMISAGKLP